MINETEQEILKAGHELDMTRIKISLMKQRAQDIKIFYRRHEPQIVNLVQERQFVGFLKWEHRQIVKEEEYVLRLKEIIEDLRNGLRILKE